MFLKFLQKLGSVHRDIPPHIYIGQVAIGALIGVPLDGLSLHLCAGEVLAVGFPHFVFVSAKNAGLPLESLGDTGGSLVNGNDSVLFHVKNLLLIFDLIFSRGLCLSLSLDLV